MLRPQTKLSFAVLLVLALCSVLFAADRGHVGIFIEKRFLKKRREIYMVYKLFVLEGFYSKGQKFEMRIVQKPGRQSRQVGGKGG